MAVILVWTRIERRWRALPVLGSFLALVGVGAVGHTLVTSVRRRRREVAVLRALGMTGRQARGVIATRASVLALVGLLLGARPVGGAAARRRRAEGRPMRGSPTAPTGTG